MAIDTKTQETLNPNSDSINNMRRGDSPESSCQLPTTPAHPFYPHQHLMRKNRIIKLKQVKSRCEICNWRAQVVHHIDESMDNHSLDNLLALCNRCHKAVHHPDKVENIKKTSKYIRLYGATMSQIAKKTAMKTSKIYEMHYTHKLRQYLDDWTRNKSMLT